MTLSLVPPPKNAEPFAVTGPAFKALLEGVPHAEYHRDAFHDGPPALSRSIACKLLNESPLHAWAAHPRLGGCARADDTAASDLGSLIHGFLLGEAQEVEIIRVHTNKNGIGPTVPAENWRTKEAQELRDAAREAGKMPLLEHVYEAALAIVDPLRNQLDEVTEGAFSEAAKEVTALWESGGVLCRARMDALHLGRGLILDLKFLANAHPADFGRSMLKAGYDMQMASYIEAVAAVHPELADSLRFQFLLVEVNVKTRIPIRLGDRFIITAPQIGASMLTRGQARWENARDRWRACLESGNWPAYETPEPIEAPDVMQAVGAGLSCEEKIDALFGEEEESLE